MKKNYLLGMFAATGMLLATSCSNDELESAQSGNEAQVTFSLAAEGGIATRAISDGKSVDQLYYAIYDANQKLITTIATSNNGLLLKEDAFPNESKKDEVKVTLAKGQEYTAVFWAQDASCDAYTVTAETDGLKVAVDYDGDNNDETRDAFFKAEKFTVAGDKTIDVVLKRPFAQINVGVYESDWDAAVASGITIENSKVVINNAATSINLLTGAVDGSTEVTYDLSAIPTETLEVETDDTKAGKEEYKWLSMSYILVADNSTTDEDNDGTLGDARTTLESLNYTFSPVSGNPITFAEGLNSVPVQRNWRTNILGKILTGDIQFNITIDPVYDGDIIYPGASEMEQQLEMAASFGGTVTLSSDVELTAPLNVTADMILNLENGAELKGSINVAEGASLTVNGGAIVNTDDNVSGIVSNGDLTLNNVKITSARHALRIESGNVVINGGTYKVAPQSVKTLHALNVGDDNTVANVTIKGGTFVGPKGTDADSGSAVNVRSGSSVTIEGGNFSGGKNNTLANAGTLIVKGGTFDQKPADLYVASGYHAISYNNNYVVVPSDVTAIAANETELADALKAEVEKINVVLLNNIDLPISSLGQQTGGSGEYKLGGTSTEEITIDLNGKKLNVTTTYWSNLGAKNDDALFTIKNGTMTSSQATGTWNSYDLCFSNCNYAIENVVFEKAISFGNANRSVSLKDVTINETHDYYAMWIEAVGQNVYINGLTINSDGRGIKIDEQYVGTPAKVTLNIKDATFKTAKKAAIVVKSAAGAEIKASNLNIDAVAEDNYHAVWVDEDAATYADKVVVNGAFKAVEGTVATVSDTQGLKDALAGGKSTILLGAGNYTFPASSLKAGVTVICEEGTVFTGSSSLNINGATVIGATFSNPNGTASTGTINGTFKKCTFSGSNASRWAYAENSDIVFEDCVFNANGVYAIHYDGTTGANILYKNCKITGWVAITGGHKSLTFDGCQIYGNGTYGVIRVYGDTTIKNCTFDVAKVNTSDVYQDGIHAVDCTITVENCVNVNGEIDDIFNVSGTGVINKK